MRLKFKNARHLLCVIMYIVVYNYFLQEKLKHWKINLFDTIYLIISLKKP